MEARPFYLRTVEQQAARAARLQRRYDRLALLRLFGFVGVVGGLILAWSTDWRLGLGVSLLLLPAVAYGLRQHRRLGRAAARAQVQGELASAELAALDHDFTRWPDGAAYADPHHPYATDLDLFGPYSLYQFLNRTVTAIGADRLAEQLLYPTDRPSAERRRTLGRTLARDPDALLRFRTLGHDLRDDAANARRLREWVTRPPVVTGGYLRVLLGVAPLLALGGFYWCFTQQPWQAGLLGLLPAALALRRYGEVIRREHAYTAAVGGLLARYADLLATSPCDVVRTANAGGQPPEPPRRAIRELAYRISQLDVRYNPFAFLLEITGLWSLQWLRQLDRWRARHRQDLPRWLEALAETDALVSWATLRYDRPQWVEPELTDEPRLTATGLGHPLLDPRHRVTNDIDLATDGHIHLVTGSNMAGKSTWLRTVGINIVLARAGGPVCARHLRTAALSVWTSMRTQDNLSESTSSFYAELRRLKAIIEAVADPDRQVFFLLDEILKGTNSRDRHTGSRALIRQLIRERGAGIIATHDLELAALAAEPGSRVENYAMEVRTLGAELVFDYRLRPGVSRSFNATALMAQMGIDIDPADIKLTHD